MGVYFAARAPEMPDHGAIYPKRIHQSVVYLTQTQSYWYSDRIFDVGFYCGVAVVLGELFRRLKNGREGDSAERIET
jgi:hypothetical protein